MDQNQTVDNDLQKAIDDIANTTNIDPVFSDPVAAPSSVPEGDTGELGEPVGPFPEPKVEAVMPAPEPIAPLQSMDIPELNMPELAPPAPAPMPPLDSMMPPAPESAAPGAPQAPEAPAPTNVPSLESAPSSNLSMHQVKEAALRDLVPLLDHLNMAPTQKFNIYRNIFENLRDYTVLESAYKAATSLPDDTERAEALLYLVESIDRM